MGVKKKKKKACIVKDSKGTQATQERMQTTEKILEGLVVGRVVQKGAALGRSRQCRVGAKRQGKGDKTNEERGATALTSYRVAGTNKGTAQTHKGRDLGKHAESYRSGTGSFASGDQRNRWRVLKHLWWVSTVCKKKKAFDGQMDGGTERGI